MRPGWGDPFNNLFTRARFAVCAAILFFVPAAGFCMQAQQQEQKPPEREAMRLLLAAPPDVADPPADAKITDSGLATKVLKEGTGAEHPVPNDCVRARFVAWKRDGTLFSTSNSMDFEVICLNTAILGVSEALQGMVAGEKIRLWLPTDLTFTEGHHHHVQKRPEDKVPPKHDLTFDLELISILKTPPTPADLSVPPADAVKTPSGLAYKVLKSGSGTKHPSMSSMVRVHFTCWTSNGRVFESTVPGDHPALVPLAIAMPGWREGLPTMVVGEKARFWIPAALAYGEKPVNGFNPAGPLVYDIELLALQ